MLRHRIALAVALISLSGIAPTGGALAEALFPAAAKPEDVGLSSDQLRRLEDVTRTHIQQGIVPGAVMLVARRGKIAWTSVLGHRDKAANAPMQMDTIFRLYSMTKPIVSVALMQMVEEGRLQIGDPVAKYLPEFKDVKVGVEKAGSDGKPMLELADPARPMTVQDLLRHTAGLTYGSRGGGLVHRAYVAAKIGDRGSTNEDFVSRLARLPLRFSPGDQWEYSVSVDVQGRLLEVLSGGKPLAQVLEERITGPLGMKDTGFWAPKEKADRIAQFWDRPGGPPPVTRFDATERARFQGGGGAMVGTTEDYLRFTLMLANGGWFQGKRILGKKTVEFMTADHTGARPGRPPGLGFGLGFEVRTRAGDAALPGSVGEYGWAGNAGTLFWIDPAEELIAIYMVQVNPADRVELRNRFRTMVQAAIID
jgi:CubicO group peptidase (beta-lactamase class C family)